jgi:hypothetical protein
MAERPPRRGEGRPLRLPTQAETDTICQVINATGSDHEAFVLARVPEPTFYLWLSRGKQDRLVGNTSSPYAQFMEAVERARATRVTTLVASIRKAGTDPRHWPANAWLLERTEPKRFGLRVRFHVEEELTSAIARIEEAFRGEPETLERALAAIAGDHRSASAELAEGGEGGADDSGGEAVPAPLPKPEAVPVPESDD